MNKNYYSCIITHGDLAYCLKGVSEKIITPATKMYYYTNRELSLDEIEKKINQQINKLKPEKSVFFIDLAGGSCWLLANRIKKNNKDIAVVSGVNVPLLISYHINFNNLDWNNLLKKIVDDGKKGIVTR